MALSKGIFPLRGVLGAVKGTLIVGAFRPNADSGIVAGSQKGHGWSVARADVGLYTITFNQTLKRLIPLSVTVREAAGAGTVVQFGDYSATAGTLQIRVFQISAGALAATDLAADADNEIGFLVMSDETNSPVK